MCSQPRPRYVTQSTIMVRHLVETMVITPLSISPGVYRLRQYESDCHGRGSECGANSALVSASGKLDNMGVKYILLQPNGLEVRQSSCDLLSSNSFLFTRTDNTSSIDEAFH